MATLLGATEGVVRGSLVDREDERLMGTRSVSQLPSRTWESGSSVVAYLCDVDVRGTVGSPDDFLCDVLTREGLEALVYGICGTLVATEAGDGEVGLDHAGLDLGDADGRVDELLEQGTGECVYSKLGRAVLPEGKIRIVEFREIVLKRRDERERGGEETYNRSSRIALSAGNGANVDNVATLALLEFC